MTDVTLVFRADASLEHPLADALLTFPEKLSFQILPVKSFHASLKLTKLSDQVSGYRKEILVQVETEAPTCEAILAHMKTVLPSAEVHYRISPVETKGFL